MLILRLVRVQEARFELKTAAVDAKAVAVEKARCVRSAPACPGRGRFVSGGDAYRSACMANVGVVQEAAVEPFRPTPAR